MEFEYTGLSFVASRNVAFKYRLEGLDRDWVEAGARRVAYYSHLPQGDYRFEVMACNLDGPAAEDKNYKINLVFSDTRESFILWIDNAVLHHKKAKPAKDANATLTLTKPIWIKMMAGTAGIKDTLLSDDLKISGSRIDLIRFFTLFDKSSSPFPIVTPR